MGGWGVKPEGNREVRHGWNQSVLFLNLFSGIALSVGVAGGLVGSGLAGVWKARGGWAEALKILGKQ